MSYTIYASLCRICGDEPARLCRNRRNGKWYLYRGAACSRAAVMVSRMENKTWKRKLSQEWR